MGFKDDDAAFYTYADEHHLTVNEVAYYLNAYQQLSLSFHRSYFPPTRIRYRN